MTLKEVVESKPLKMAMTWGDPAGDSLLIDWNKFRVLK